MFWWRRRGRRFSAVLLPLLLGACAPDAPPPEGGVAAGVIVEDDSGREVRLARPAGRVVSLVPALTDLVVALGARERLVARTDYDADPALAHLPSVGGGLTPSLEWLAAQRPDLVLAWPDERSRSVVGRLEGLGAAVYAARTETLADAGRHLERIGQLLGLERAADSLAAAIRSGLDDVRREVAGRSPPTVLYVIGLDPPMAAGPGTFVDELLQAAGGRNVFADAGSRWPQFSLEDAVRRQPDVVIVAQGEARAPALGRLRGATGWRELRAVRAGRVHDVDADLFNRPGPRVPEAARRLARILHPAAFSGKATR